jgi:predicted branched-subunit amino acid permease
MDAKHRTALLIRGFSDALPLVPGVVAFGLVYGVAALAVNPSPAETAGMSAIVHAGSSQFAALGNCRGPAVLLGHGRVAVTMVR